MISSIDKWLDETEERFRLDIPSNSDESLDYERQEKEQKLIDLCKKYREALKFYGDPDIFCAGGDVYNSIGFIEKLGYTARKVLEEIE